jgi:hypothetical protein
MSDLVSPIPVGGFGFPSKLDIKRVLSVLRGIAGTSRFSGTRLTPSWNPRPPPHTAIPKKKTVATPIIPRLRLPKGSLSSNRPTKMAPRMAPRPSSTATSARVRPLNLATFRAPCCRCGHGVKHEPQDEGIPKGELAHVGVKVVGGKEHGKEDDHAPILDDLPHAGDFLLESRLGLNRDCVWCDK